MMTGQRGRIIAAALVLLLAGGCADDRSMEDLLADACADVHAGRWIEAREPLKVAADRDPSLSNLYSLVRASAEPAEVPAWAANEMGAEAYEGRPTPELLEAWRGNAQSGCRRLGYY